jgi:hypothetical protein
VQVHGRKIRRFSRECTRKNANWIYGLVCSKGLGIRDASRGSNAADPKIIRVYSR